MVLTLRYVAGVSPAKWLRTWAERRPDLPIEAMRVEQAEQLADLVAGRADLAFVRLPIEADAMHAIPLWEEAPVAVLPKDHAFADAESLTTADLETELRAPMQTEAAMTIELIAAGAGYAIVPHGVARLHHRRDVVAVPVTDAAPTRIALVWRVDRDDADIQEFVGVVRGRTARSSRGADDGPGSAASKPSSIERADTMGGKGSAGAKGGTPGRNARRGASARSGRAVRKRGGRGR
ncbi:LysR family transcriptional regulator substrate-binding protein [Agromyces sp. Marseille-P2726]|uniref:LysR family transcriptional regulator substrate-binding protein n=1 Tax=Agromyces sp. Marseille-P2726 TaxID=2709132 RepID=UPI00156FD6BA|nr:LysR family transcriptional regulator substrate-binding protein [Agromyces sp. Marseille-P2726]